MALFCWRFYCLPSCEWVSDKNFLFRLRFCLFLWIHFRFIIIYENFIQHKHCVYVFRWQLYFYVWTKNRFVWFDLSWWMRVHRMIQMYWHLMNVKLQQNSNMQGNRKNECRHFHLMCASFVHVHNVQLFDLNKQKKKMKTNTRQEFISD